MLAQPPLGLGRLGYALCHSDSLYAISYDFTQAIVDPLRRVGVRFSDQEIEDIYALWRYIGWVMGVPEHLRQRNAAHGRQLADIYLSLDPGADDECRRLVKQLIELATQEGDDAPNLDVVPKVVTTLFPPLRLRKLLYGFTRYWAGDVIAGELGVPDTWHKRLPHLAKPVMAALELGRRSGLIDDTKLCRSTLALLSASAAPTGAETTIATAGGRRGRPRRQRAQLRRRPRPPPRRPQRLSGGQSSSRPAPLSTAWRSMRTV